MPKFRLRPHTFNADTDISLRASLVANCQRALDHRPLGLVENGAGEGAFFTVFGMVLTSGLPSKTESWNISSLLLVFRLRQASNHPAACVAAPRPAITLIWQEKGGGVVACRELL